MVIEQLDIETIRKDFPVLHQEVNGKPLIYFDNAATTHKPQQVIDGLVHYYSKDNANIHRGIHALAERATAAFEETRDAVKDFLGASKREEIIFTRGVTDSINLVATAWGRKFIQEGDEIIVSTMEHHSNIVPWQMLCEEKKAVLKVIEVDEKGDLNYEQYKSILSSKTKLVSVMHASNVLGTINDVKTIIDEAHNVGAKVFIDGAQSAAHININVQDLDCDFFAFSAHKIYGPTGTGALYGKFDILNEMNPYQGGGEMIAEVDFGGTTYNELPYKFEAGTPNIADVVAMKFAIDYINKIGKESILKHEEQLVAQATDGLKDVPEIQFFGTSAHKVGVVSFTLANKHHFDAGMLLDAMGIAVRTGHHCAQPLMKRYAIEGTIRASFAAYNTEEEVEKLIQSVHKISKI